MYEDLVKSLRICAVDGSCRTCPRFLICNNDEEEHVLEGLFNDAADAIEELQAADVRPVVTCGRCKYADSFSPTCTESTFPLKCLSIRYGGVYPDWFCEHGEIAQKSNCGADMREES